MPASDIFAWKAHAEAFDLRNRNIPNDGWEVRPLTTLREAYDDTYGIEAWDDEILYSFQDEQDAWWRGRSL